MSMKGKKESALTSPYVQQRHVWEGEEEACDQSMKCVGLCVLTIAGVIGGILVAIVLVVSALL